MIDGEGQQAVKPRRSLEHFTGCLLGGAVGDALGAPVEFISSLAGIRARFGPGGARDFVSAYGRPGMITDDTQMTLFTAEGLLEAGGRERGTATDDAVVAVYHAYLRWLETQEGRAPYPCPEARGGRLLAIPAMHAARAPGNTCLSALRSGRMGSVEKPVNNSKGCGGVMRAAPAGLVGWPDPFRLGCAVAAITHGNPSGYLAAGFLASLIAELVQGSNLETAIEHAREALIAWPGHEECLAAVDTAVELARNTSPSAGNVERLGEGWVAEEALAISLYCALVAPNFEEGVVLAVNHRGDSDSTGAITGNILGLIHGVDAIPRRWLEGLELREVIEETARQLHQAGSRLGRPLP